MTPKHAITVTAAGILVAFAKSGAQHLIPAADGSYLRLDTTDKAIKVSQLRLLNDDLASLVSSGFLTEQIFGKWRFFEITSRGVSFAEQLNDSANS